MKFELIPKTAIKKHVTVAMSIITILVIGLIALKQIKLEFMPKGITSPYLGAWVSMPNSTPEEVEEQIIKKLEAALNTVPNKVRSNAFISSNGSWVGIEFTPDADLDQAYMDFVDRIERLKPELPPESQNVRIRRFKAGDDDDVSIFITTEKNTGDEYNFVKNFIVKRYERIDGVANIDFDASGEKSIYIYINTDLIKSYNVNISDVISRLRQENFNLSSGWVMDGEHKMYVRSTAKIYSLDKLQNLIINDRGLKLKEIANVEFTTGEEDRLWQINRKPGMDLEIVKEPLANTIEVTDEIAKVTEELNNHPLVKAKGVKLDIIFNKGTFIKQSVFNLLESGLWGGFFAFLFIYLFLKRFRMTTIITLAIPASILISIICLYFMDLSLNGMTLMGLLIAVGLVVDNAIVIVENIYQKRQEGLGIVDSAIQGTAEVGLAITLSTLTTVAIFLPIFFLPANGMSGFFKAIAMPIVFAMLASLVVAIIYIPYMSTRISSAKEIKEANWIKSIGEKFAKVTLFFVKRRVDAMILFLALMAFLLFAPGPEELGMGGDGNINDFRIMVNLPDNYTFDKTKEIVKVMEDYADTKREEYHIVATSTFARKNFFRMNVFLEPKEIPAWYVSVYRDIRRGLKDIGIADYKERITREDAEADFKKVLPDIPGMRIRANWSDRGMIKSDPSLTLEVEGDETRKLIEISKEIQRRLESIDVVVKTDINIENGLDEVQVHLDREKMTKYGVNPATARQIVNFNIRGAFFNSFQNEKGEEIRMIAQAQRKDRERLEQLKNLSIFSYNGTQIPLSSIASFEISKGLGNINHSNGKTILQVKAIAENEENVGIIKKELASVMSGLSMPIGYKWGLGRIARQQAEENNQIVINLIMGMVLVFLLMGVLFESFILPFSVIVSVPLAFVGSKFLMLITGTGSDLMAKIGYIILVGIVVNNGIVLIDAVNRLRKKGFSRNDAIYNACKKRVRPIILTAITTIGGLLPMALGESEFIGIKYAPLGRVVFGGLLASTILTIIFTPVFYTFFDDIREKLMKLFTSMFIKKDSVNIEQIEN
jgi:hydrophobic/amphiphilic exporter-1 (mainly G- bacteria), HAE1 family